MSRKVLVCGWVYCDVHCGVHEDTTDPYDEGRVACPKSEHRTLYANSRKFDTPGETL